MQQKEARKGAITIRGYWHTAKRLAKANGIEMPMPLKEAARRLAASGVKDDPVVLDAQRWLQSKRPGGTDAERKARREKRLEQQGIRLLARASRKGKGSLKPSGEGKKKKGKRDGGD